MQGRAGIRDFTPVIIAYLAALIVAVGVVMILPYGILLKTFIADIAATVVIFIFGRLYKNASFYDAYWSVVPPVIMAYWIYSFGGVDNTDTRSWIILVLTLWWALRLTLNWAGHWPGLSHEDWRYQPIRDNAGKGAVLADFFGIHFFPTVIVFLSCLPAYAVIAKGASVPLGWLDYVAIIVTAGAIIIETVSDLQLHAFNHTKKSGEFITTGLWRYSRHPNYFGEFGFWIGLALFGLAAYPAGWWWIIPGAVALGWMFVFVSIPLMDERSTTRRPGYEIYIGKTSALIPWFPR